RIRLQPAPVGIQRLPRGLVEHLDNGSVQARDVEQGLDLDLAQAHARPNSRIRAADQDPKTKITWAPASAQSNAGASAPPLMELYESCRPRSTSGSSVKSSAAPTLVARFVRLSRTSEMPGSAFQRRWPTPM